ncbi:hypothetical protein SteCoe_16724 [Stentor coeruleus]|uniref:Uncharacterized protein n=1 Tax=Stentor coeruleus TaxID=5963 RepID=A0A1R2C0R0_9CILI|nr:hypothetical protein SteCoe_16724 [Stentor coeruleus]
MDKEAEHRISRESSLSIPDSDSLSFDIPELEGDNNPGAIFKKPSSDIIFLEKNHTSSKKFPLPQEKNKHLHAFVEELEKKLKVPLPKDSIESLSLALQKIIYKKIECTTYDLKQLIDDTYKIIQNYENYHIKDCRLSLGNILFTLTIQDKEIYVGKKQEISKLFNPTSEIVKKTTDFPDTVLDMCRNYELSMQKAFENSIYDSTPDVVPCKSLPKSGFLHDLQLQLYITNTLEQRTMKRELEWGKSEMKALKGQLKDKIHDVQIKIRDNKNEFFKLKEERARLLKEKEEIEKNSEDLDDKKRKFLKWADGLKKLVDNLIEKNDVGNMSSFQSMNNSFMSVEQSFINEEDEQKSLESELKELEAQLDKVPKDRKDSLQTRIQRIKTRIQAIKSEKLISQSSRRTTRLKTAVCNMQNLMGIKYPLPHTPLSSSHKTLISVSQSSLKRPSLTPLPFPLAPIHNRSTTYTPISPLNLILNKDKIPTTNQISEKTELHTHVKSESCFNFDIKKPIETEEKDEAVGQTMKSLVMREARLAEKEEELMKREKWIRGNLEKCRSDKEYLELLKSERMNMNRSKKELEAKGKNLEGKYVEVEKIEFGVKRKSECLDRMSMELDADRVKLDNEREELIQKIEDIKRFVEENI